MSLDSTITHVSPLPNDLKLNDKCKYSYNNSGISGFGFVDSGYSFGGYRSESNLYPNGKRFGLEECSSWVYKITNCPVEYSTADQLCTDRVLRSSGNEHVPNNWKNNVTGKAMLSLYQVVAVIQLLY